jgi:2-polyprenyl-3-methyl-5-hydroxy-6-metoxy-1,4-benzoquinol methylase
MPKLFDLGEVPFYWRVKTTLTQMPRDVPVRLSFAFSFIDELQLVIQKRDPITLRWLERVYKEDANVGYLQDGHALAKSYSQDFIGFFRRAVALLPTPPSTAADIGCGGVYLLQMLRENGLQVTGIDPSPVTAIAGQRAGIQIISDFYPSLSLVERFDILIHYDVLEHVEDPVAFLRAHHNNLSEQGVLIFAVPDCSQHIALGDVSMLLHEHLNYFDEESLARVVLAAGFDLMLLEPARHGGVLFCCAVPKKSDVGRLRFAEDSTKFQSFCAKAQVALLRFADLVRDSGRDGLGLYVPLRAFPYLAQLPSETKVRFFDDDPGLHGCYYDGYDCAVESIDELVNRPPARLIICSLAFGKKIAVKIHERRIKNLQIVIWPELFHEIER